jgi:hypothetical protein
MRLTAAEITGLITAIQSLSPSPGISLLLYGSRVHDHLRGGDIDLVLEIPPGKESEWEDNRLKLLVEIKSRLGDQRIDLSILTAEAIRQSQFFALALRDAKLIHRW